MINRRTFLAGTGVVLLAAPLPTEAQQAGKVYRVGVIAGTTSVAELAQHSGVGAFVQRLRELGWNEGRHIVIERRTSEGKTERFAPLTAEFVALGVDVIVLVSLAGAVAARGVTATTPIVMVTSAWGTGVAPVPPCAIVRAESEVSEAVDLAIPLVHVDANVVHGWPLPSCGVDRGGRRARASLPPRRRS